LRSRAVSQAPAFRVIAQFRLQSGGLLRRDENI
jgi:hypothetical protein